MNLEDICLIVQGHVPAWNRGVGASTHRTARSSCLSWYLAFCFACFGPIPVQAGSHLLVLSGQSNMEGYGVVADAGFADSIPEVKIWNGVGELSGTWGPLRPGLALKASNFGPEMTLGSTLMAKLPQDTFYLIKVAMGGTTLAEHWLPPSAGGPGEWYSTLVRNVAQAREALRGIEPRFAGFFWMQGESDAFLDSTSQAYESRLRSLISDLRTTWAVAELPFFIGLIDSQPVWPFAATVRDAQSSVARTTSRTVTVETVGVQTDGVHYGTEGQKELGRRFADSWLGMENTSVASPRRWSVRRYASRILVEGVDTPARARWIGCDGRMSGWIVGNSGSIEIQKPGHGKPGFVQVEAAGRTQFFPLAPAF